MRKTFILLLVIFSVNSFCQETVVRIRCKTSSTVDKQPLIVLDGVPVTVNALKNIDPAMIDHINILKDTSVSKIYGATGAGGVILVTTKKKGHPVMVTDSSGISMPAVTITVSGSNTQLVTNEKGLAYIAGYDPGKFYAVEVSAIGYQTKTVMITPGVVDTSFIRLERDYKKMEEVVLTACIYGGRRRCLNFGCHVRSIRTYQSLAGTTKKPFPAIYPNPAQSKQSINLQLPSIERGFIRLLNSSGQVVGTTGVGAIKDQIFRYQLPDLPPGVYVVVVTAGRLSEKVLAEKLVVQ